MSTSQIKDLADDIQKEIERLETENEELREG